MRPGAVDPGLPDPGSASGGSDFGGGGGPVRSSKIAWAPIFWPCPGIDSQAA